MGTRKAISVLIIVVFLLGNLFTIVVADNPIIPTADSYTDGSDPEFTWDLNFGAEPVLQLSASNLAGCIPTTYLWYKFPIPSTSETIATAVLSLSFGTAGASGTMDMELLGSSNISWDELGITWNNQPALDIGQLATAQSVAGGQTAVFTGSTLANYLNNHKGETITLVVRANCAGTVSASANRTIASKENPAGSGARLELYNPTSVTLSTLTASNQISTPWLLVASLFILITIAVVSRILHTQLKLGQ